VGGGGGERPGATRNKKRTERSTFQVKRSKKAVGRVQDNQEVGDSEKVTILWVKATDLGKWHDTESSPHTEKKRDQEGSG